METDLLSVALRRFYAEARTKKGVPYSRPAMIAIRASLQRHLISPPHNRTISIVSDREFTAANQVFTGRLKINRADGNDTTKHKAVIEAGDIAKMYESHTLSNANPVALQNKVFFEISLHFLRRAKEGLRELRKDSFEIRTDDEGKRYATITYQEKSKKDKGDKRDFVEKDQRMYERPEDKDTCPLFSLELYLSKLDPKSNDFFQQVRRNITLNAVTWYNGRPIGANTIAGFMSRISKDAELSMVYTNHCIRVTAITCLSNEGINETNIIALSGHRKVQSLIPYQRKLGTNKRRNISNMLALYGKKKENEVALSSQNVTTQEEAIRPLPDLRSNLTVPTHTVNSSSVNYQSQLQGLLHNNTFNAQHVTFNVNVMKE